MFIEIKDLKKNYGEGEHKAEVLKSLSVSIPGGEIIVFLGPSGSGKSTLLNIIGGIETIDGGEVIVDGKNLAELKKSGLSDYRRLELGFIFQFYNLIPNLTVKENIESGAYLSKNPLNTDEVLNILGLREHRNKFPNQLSGGQQQRTAIGRAIVKNPKLLLCDEPTGALDYQTSLEVLKLIQTVNREYGTSILIATHNTEISRICRISFRMRDGKLEEPAYNENIAEAEELSW